MKALKIAIRSLLHFRWYAAINILGLALSLACVIVIFRYVYGEITVDRYIPDLDRVFITTREVETDDRQPFIVGVRNPNNDKGFIDLLKSPAIEVWTEFRKNDDERITCDDKKYSVGMVVADSNFNKIFDLRAVSGTLDLSVPRNAAVSLDFSRRLFGDEDPLGKVIKLSSGFTVAITAVMDEPSTASSFGFDLLVSQYISEHWSNMSMTAVRLYPNQDYESVNEQYSKFFSVSYWHHGVDVRFQLFPYKDIYLNSSHLNNYFFERGNRTNVFLLFGAGMLILLVGVVNFINIYLAVAMRRGREWGMKKVFGARGPQIFTQLWVENTLLVAISLLIALAITEMVSPLVKNLLGLQQIPFKAFDFSLVGIFLVTLPLLTTLIPFLKYNYSMPVNSLRSIGMTGGRGLTRKIFLGLQYTITIFMIVIAVFFNRQLYGMLNADPGFRTKNIIQVEPFLGHMSDHSLHEDEEEWEARDKRNKAIGQVITQRMDASQLFEKWCFGDNPIGRNGTVRFSYADGELKDLNYASADQKWMEMFELKLVDGRVFDNEIEHFGIYDLVATESVLKQYGIDDWRSAKLRPEQRLWYDMSISDRNFNPPYNILGVVRDFNGFYLGGSFSPVAFFYSEEDPREPLLASFREGDRQQVIEFLRELHDETVGGEFVYSFIEDDMRALYDEDRKVATVFTIFTMIAILISVMGLFSMSLFDIEQRYNEIAIRKVNGATTGQIIEMLLRKYIVLLAIAFVVAVPAAWIVLTRYLEDFAFKTPLSWWIFALALVITAGVSLLTLIVQTRKAAETNPASVIRNE